MYYKELSSVRIKDCFDCVLDNLSALHLQKYDSSVQVGMFASSKRLWSYSLPDWLTNHISLFFISNRGYPYSGTCLELYFHVFYKSLVARNNIYRGLPEGHESIYSPMYSKIYPCSMPDLGGLRTQSTLAKNSFTGLKFSCISSAYIEGAS